MHREETDEEIVNSYKKGNKEVFKTLIDRYTSPLFAFTARLAKKENAQDIVQEIFIKVWKKLDNFDEEKSSFKTWIFTIAKNTSIDFLRKKKFLTFSDLENYEDDFTFSETIPDESLLPDEILQKLEDKNLLNKLLEEINLEWKTILILHYQEEMTFDEISKILNKPLNTIKSNHRRALIKLRKMI